VVGVLLFLITVAGPALAHSDLVSSTPEDGQVLTAAPSSVSLTFNEPISDTGAAVVVKGDEGRIDTPSSLTVDGSTVSVEVDARAPGGGYTVAYRVVSADGHVITGSLRYAVEEAEPATSTAAPETPDATPEVAPAATDTDDSSGGLPAVGWLLAVLGVAGAALAAVVLAGRRAGG
jgi:methionine-rich copper-binding protein CopC